MSSTRASTKTPDLLVIGAGVAGLWTAWKAVREGLSVVVAERDVPGAGASGGVLGALMPHRPSQWTQTKQFQLEALMALPEEVGQLEAATGLACGYRRCGRLMPIDSERRLAEHEQWQAAAGENWAGTDAQWSILDGLPPKWADVMRPCLAFDHDTLSARVSPRGLVQALAEGVRRAGGELRTGCEIAGLRKNGEAYLADGSQLRAGHVVLAAGFESFPVLDGLGFAQAGWGVKGQAVVLNPVRSLPEDLPILYRGGAYVIAHDDGTVAVGSTSEREFDDALPDGNTAQALQAKAIELCPLLEGAKIAESWAGIRPRAAGRQPLVGPVPGTSNLTVLTGGFKISLGIAHKLADAALASVVGEDVRLPAGFTPDEQLKNSL